MASSIVDETIELSELRKLQENYERQVERGEPSANSAFAYAHGLIRSNAKNKRIGIQLLNDLRQRSSEDDAKRDYVYYLAIAHTRLKEYDRAMQYVNALLSVEADNRQVIELKQAIEKRMRNDGILGAAIIGGGAAVVAGIIIAAFAASRR